MPAAPASPPSPFFQYPGEEMVSRQPFLAHLHEDEMNSLVRVTQARRYSAGDQAVHEGDHDRTLFIIVKGSFDVILHGAAGAVPVATLTRGDIFGELSFFDSEPRSADVVARGPAEVLLLTPAGFDRLQLARPALALKVVLDLGRILAQRLRGINGRLATTDR